MFKIKSIFVLALSFIILIGLMGTSLADEKEFIAIGTGNIGGGFYPVGGAIGQILSDNVEGIVATAQTSLGSRANCNLIGRGEVETAIVCANVANWSYHASEIYADEPPITNLRGIAALYDETLHVVAHKDSEIKSMEDLRGKRVCVGPPNSGDAALAKIVLSFYSLTFDDIEPQWVDYNEGNQRLCDGQVDVLFFITGFPAAVILDLESKRPIELIPFEREKIDEIVSEFPYFKGGLLPAGGYKGIDEPILVLKCPSLWICDAELTDDLVYKLTKGLWEHRDLLEEYTTQGKNIRLENALLGMGIPLHPGAEKYYKEMGLMEF